MAEGWLRVLSVIVAHTRMISYCAQVPAQLLPEWKVKTLEPTPTTPKSMPPWVRTAAIAGGAGAGGLLLVGLAICFGFAAMKRRREEQKHLEVDQGDRQRSSREGPPGAWPTEEAEQGRKRPKREAAGVKQQKDGWSRQSKDDPRWLMRAGREGPGLRNSNRRRGSQVEMEGRSSREQGRGRSRQPAEGRPGGSVSPAMVNHDGFGAPQLLIPTSRTGSGSGEGWGMASPQTSTPRQDGGRGSGPKGSPGGRPRQMSQLYNPGEEEGDWLPGTPRGGYY